MKLTIFFYCLLNFLSSLDILIYLFFLRFFAVRFAFFRCSFCAFSLIVCEITTFYMNCTAKVRFLFEIRKNIGIFVGKL